MIVRFVFLAVLFLSGFVQAIDVYVIKNIKIYANNKSASIARNEAIEAGQLKAFRGLIKLHYPDALSKINSIDKEDIYSLVESYDLSEEKRSSTNYYAKMNVRFSVEHVNKLMQGMGFQFYGAVSKQSANEELPIAATQVTSAKEVVEDLKLTTLVVPIFVKNGREYWFDDGNSWLETWQKRKQTEKFVLPLVDLEDLSIINNKILNKNLIDLASLFEKYSVNNIALYTFEDIENGSNHHVTFKVNYLNKYHYSWRSYYFQDEVGSDLNALLDKAFDAAQSFKFNSNLDTCCNIVNDLEGSDPKKFVINYKINGISDWIQLEQIMKSIKYISDVNIEQVTAEYYTFSIMCSISQENLAGIFARYNLNLEEKNNKLMLIAKSIEE